MIRYPDTAWVEVKATRNKVTLGRSNNQIRSEMNSLARTNPQATARGIAQYIVVTTASYDENSMVGRGVYKHGSNMGIQVLNIQPVYKQKNRQVYVQYRQEGRATFFSTALPLGVPFKYKF